MGGGGYVRPGWGAGLALPVIRAAARVRFNRGTRGGIRLEGSAENGWNGSGASAQGTTAGSSGGISGSGSGSGTGGLVPTEAIIASCEWLSSVAGTNAVTAATVTAYTALAAGFMVRFVPANTNTTAVTLNVNAIGAKAVTRNGTAALVGGELQAGRTYVLEYDGTQWQIIGVSMPVNALLLGSDASGNPVAMQLASAEIIVGSAGGLPIAVVMSGGATISNTGVVTLNITSAEIVAALGFTPARSGANSSFSLTAPVGGGAVTGTITQV